MRTFILLLCTTTLLLGLDEKSERQIVDLRGTWKFEIGDNPKYASPTFDDKSWDEIFVPSNWEDEGFAGYDGYAWYRRTFTFPANVKGKRLIVNMGFVDDVCGVYVNGTLIGEGGRFKPQYQTGYNIEQRFNLPEDLLRPGKENVIAVRVYDAMQGGGIVRGRIGISEEVSDIDYVVRFPLRWKFKAGDEERWKDPAFNDKEWSDLLVPAKWDFQGFREYDGYGWYRVTFDLPPGRSKERLVVLLGKIDDVDEAFLNGERIGRTGRIRSNGSIATQNDYQKLRGYDIPSSLLKEKGNVLAVRVYDNFMDGGIYEGPVGIITDREFDRFDRRNEQWDFAPANEFERIIDKIFR
ncbi:MAG: beta galactosidase jelly roll domain-containing protein [Bacteroidetes bacterium]|nr:beta galactosidase jelly roll domain-containing protein [Bacteroidota bacterium]